MTDIAMPTRNRHLRVRAVVLSLAGIAFCVGALAGCGLPGRAKTPPMATYVLDAPMPTVSVDAAAPQRVLRVATPTAAPAYASSRMAYIETPYRIDYFAQNEWADSPARMLKTLLTQYLSASGLFRFVYADAGGIEEGLRLDTEIVELVQVFAPDSSEVRLTIRFSLVDVSRRAILLTRTITATEPATTRDPYAGVVAANKALQRVLEQLTQLLRAQLPSLERTESASAESPTD
jgi:cholesterol transport system auxiliary component